MPSRAERKKASRIERRNEDRAVAAGDVAGEIETPHRKRKRSPSAVCRLEYRVRPERGTSLPWARGWRPYWRRYATEKQRDAAMTAMNKQNGLFEYRVTSELDE